MPLKLPTLDDMVAAGLAIWRNRWPGKDSHTESFIGKEARAMAAFLASFHRSVEAVDNDAVPSSKTSTAGLDRFAYTFGLESDVAGTYGRKGPQAATTAGMAQCTGTNGTVFPDGAQLLAPDGATILKLSGAVTIPGTPPGTGSVTGSFVAVTKGTVGNLPIGTVLQWISPPSGADATVTLTVAISGGVDSETDPAVLARIFDRLQRPPASGNAADFRRWAEAAGAYRAYVYPVKKGSDSVVVVLTAPGSGRFRIPAGAVQTAVDASIGKLITEFCEGYESALPYMLPSGQGAKIRLRMVPRLSKYAFDWSLGTSPFTVASYAAGPPGVITMNQALPASLTAAVDAGKKPRLQVMSTGGPVVPVPVAVTAYNAGAQTLTLDTPLPASWVAPTSGDAVYPFGPMVTAVAAAIVSYVDSLGPSRASGKADVNDPWEDTIELARLAQVALDVTDTDGTRFASNAILSGITINGSNADLQATDDLNGIQLLYATSVAITD